MTLLLELLLPVLIVAGGGGDDVSARHELAGHVRSGLEVTYNPVFKELSRESGVCRLDAAIQWEGK